MVENSEARPQNLQLARQRKLKLDVAWWAMSGVRYNIHIHFFMSPGAGFPGCELDGTVFWCVLTGPHLHTSIKACRPILAYGDGFSLIQLFLCFR